MRRCRIRVLPVALLPLATTRVYAGHAGEMDAPGLMPHELVASLVGLAAILLLAILALAWVVWRLRRLDRRLRELEESRKL
jgi:flagellar biogenesis protein FliO